MLKIKDKIKNLNIVKGCKVGCRYCYAKINCQRFHLTKDFTVPEFFPDKLRLFPTKLPKIFLLTGLSDLAYWDKEWFNMIVKEAQLTQENIYLFLTKKPELLDIKTNLANLWFGVTVIRKEEKEKIAILQEHVKAKHYFVTFEPMANYVEKLNLKGIEWVVVGTETGNRTGKISSKPEWILGIAQQATRFNIPLFMKEDVCPHIIAEENLRQEFPQAFMEVLNNDK